MDKTGEDGSGLHLDKFEKRRPTLFQIYGSQLLCGHDFANERLLVCQFDV